jgi:hypothetical protein
VVKQVAEVGHPVSPLSFYDFILFYFIFSCCHYRHHYLACFHGLLSCQPPVSTSTLLTRRVPIDPYHSEPIPKSPQNHPAPTPRSHWIHLGELQVTEERFLLSITHNILLCPICCVQSLYKQNLVSSIGLDRKIICQKDTWFL